MKKADGKTVDSSAVRCWWTARRTPRDAEQIKVTKVRAPHEKAGASERTVTLGGVEGGGKGGDCEGLTP